MKSLFFVVTAAAALAAPRLLCKSDSCCSAYSSPSSSSVSEGCEEPTAKVAVESLAQGEAPRGRYLEARTASVYAGACHYGGERVADGRRAVLGFQFDAGTHDGVSLIGLTVGALVSSADNLQEDQAERRSVIYLPVQANSDQAAALEAWIREEHGTLLGEVAQVRKVPFSFTCEGEDYAMHMGDTLQLEGSLMPNRECCKMPFGRWYEPLAEGVQDSIVGCSSTFRATEPLLEAEFGRAEANDAYVGSFGVLAS